MEQETDVINRVSNSPYAEALFNDHKDNLFYIANPIGVDSPIPLDKIEVVNNES